MAVGTFREEPLAVRRIAVRNRAGDAESCRRALVACRRQTADPPLNRSGLARAGCSQVNPGSSSAGWRAVDRRRLAGRPGASPAAPHPRRALPPQEEAYRSPSTTRVPPKAQVCGRRTGCRTGNGPCTGEAKWDRLPHIRHCRPWTRARPLLQPMRSLQPRTCSAAHRCLQQWLQTGPGRRRRRSRTARTRTRRSAHGRSGV